MNSSYAPTTTTIDHHLKALRPALNVMASKGFSADTCLAETGIALEDLDRPDAHLRREHEWRFYRRLLQLTQEPALGLEVGSAYRMESYGVLGYAMLSASTLGDAVKLASEFDLLTYTHFRVELVVDAQFARLQLYRPDILPADLQRFYEDRELAAILAASEQALGHPMQPHSIAMMHRGAESAAIAPGDAVDDFDYGRHFGCPIDYGQAYCEVRFDAQLLAAPMPMQDAQTSRFCRQQCEQLMARLGQSTDFVNQVRGLLIAQPRQFAQVNALAHALNMSPRTLRRRLQAEGVSYQQLLDEIRYQLAQEYLGSQLSLEQVAELLGYSEASNFSHAFKRWHGSSPAEFRAQASR